MVVTTVGSRIRSAAGWAVWLLHHPLGVLWLATAGFVVGAVVTVFTAPRSALHMLELAGTMGGCVKVFAHVKGISAWPPFMVRKI